MVSVDSALQLHIEVSSDYIQVYAPGESGHLEPIKPTPTLLRAYYVSKVDDETGNGKAACWSLDTTYAHLMLVVKNPDGPPLRRALIFTHAGQGRAPRMEWYKASTSRGNDAWREHLSRGELGYFATGSALAPDLWRIVHCETDAAFRYIFTLSPVRLPHDLPIPDFSKIANPVLRKEAEHHWKNLEQALLNHSYYPLVSASAGLAEALLRCYLYPAQTANGKSLYNMLHDLRVALKSNRPVPFTMLSYHFMQTMRLMREPGLQSATGSAPRPLRPGVALTVAEGIVEVLSSVGVVT